MPADRHKALERIWAVVRDIPYGHVTSYGQVADIAGLPRRGRLVGYALRVAPSRLKLPWHRVINAQGRISFPKGSDSYEAQVERLAGEGIVLINGRVDFKRYRWQPSLDELLWKPRR